MKRMGERDDSVRAYFLRLLVHSSQRDTRSYLQKKQSHISQFPPEMILLKSHQNFQSRLKSNVYTMENKDTNGDY